MLSNIIIVVSLAVVYLGGVVLSGSEHEGRASSRLKRPTDDFCSACESFVEFANANANNIPGQWKPELHVFCAQLESEEIVKTCKELTNKHVAKMGSKLPREFCQQIRLCEKQVDVFTAAAVKPDTINKFVSGACSRCKALVVEARHDYKPLEWEPRFKALCHSLDKERRLAECMDFVDRRIFAIFTLSSQIFCELIHLCPPT